MYILFIYFFKGNYIYAINGPTSQMIPVQGFTLNPLTESIIDHWDSFAQVYFFVL